MTILLFEDDYIRAHKISDGLKTVSKKIGSMLGYNLTPIHIVAPGNDWWDFMEHRLYENPISPEERAASGTVVSPKFRFNACLKHKMWMHLLLLLRLRQSQYEGEFWLIDLDLSKVNEEQTIKLRKYFEAHCEANIPLRDLFDRANLSLNGIDRYVPGLAIAAYAKQHAICCRFVTSYDIRDSDFRNLLSYLALGLVTAPKEEDWGFDKLLLEVKDKGAINDEEKKEISKVLNWITAGGKRKPISDRKSLIKGNKSTNNKWTNINTIVTIIGIFLGIIGIVLFFVDHPYQLVLSWFRSLW